MSVRSMQRARRAGREGRTWSQPRVPEPAMRKGCASLVKSTSLVMRMASPKTGMKSGEMCDMDGCALA